MNLPLEVKLVSEVRQCKACKWFWDGVPPYGKFPVYDWNEDFPKAVKDQEQTTETVVSRPLLTGKVCGLGQVEPGVMHGCRKAPIMTIGINPNMTSYFPSSAGARWCYPHFCNDARYAYYYRHHSVYQESLDPALLKSRLAEGTALVAEKDGWLLSTTMCSDHRWLLLTLQYEGEDTVREIEVAWTEELRFILFVEATPKPNPKKHGFKQGDIIGGKLADPAQDNAIIFSNNTGYYQRYLRVLEAFKLRPGVNLDDAPLSITEDVAQHDMIGCASPGWSSKYDIPTDKITKNCVIERAFLLSQLIQSRPKVIVIVGTASLEMFARIFAPYLPDFDYMTEGVNEKGKPATVVKETYQLLKETTDREVFLKIEFDNFKLQSRLVIAPHFSYPDNFAKHSRLSQKAWQAFKSDFPGDATVLEEDDRLQDNSWNTILPIKIDGPNDPIKQKLSLSAWNVLMAYYCDPIQMLADVLEQEYRAGRLSFNEKTRHLDRSEGSCLFCGNGAWQFPEACPYAKAGEVLPAEGELEAVVCQVLQGRP